MSHFTVLVIGPDVAAALAPFEETAETPVYEAPDTEDAMRAKYAERTDKTESFEAFVTDYYGYRLNAETGKWMTRRNPRAKWDWWKIGGRWPDQLITKGSVPCNSACVADLDFEAMRAAAIAKADGWWVAAMKEEPQHREWRYGIKPETTREQYLKSHEDFTPFAVLKGGEWFEKGRMGWWATVSNEKPESEWKSQVAALLCSLGPDEVLTVVDCHI